MNPLEVKDVAAPMATLVAALLAGSFGRWTSQVRLTRLKTAIEVRDKIDEDLRPSWDLMIGTDAEEIVRQSERAPAPIWIVIWLSGMTLALGSWAGQPIVEGVAGTVFGLSWLALALWGVRRVRAIWRAGRRSLAQHERNAIAQLQEMQQGSKEARPTLGTAAPSRNKSRRKR